MEQRNQTTELSLRAFWNFLRYSRIQITRNGNLILNPPLLLCGIALLVAHRLVIVGVIIALILGCCFSLAKHTAE